ncbi:MAG TPA: Wzz/FepE/Etk N-terminal domain-containing protein [Terriglobia bacterium]|nr:Wzz/FepE/Etk N-terminal domain-containing protein [Terriglobia bacterium]
MAGTNVSSWTSADFGNRLSLRDLVAPLFRRKALLVTTFLVTLGAVILLGLLIPAPYKSQMSMLVDRERHDPLVSTEATNQMPPMTNSEVTLSEITSEMELLQSQDLLQKVVLATGLADRHGFSVWDLLHPGETKEDRVARAVKRLAKNLKVTNETNSDLINISYSSPDPHLSFAVLHALGDAYVEKHVALHRPPGTFLFFDHETQRYQKALQDSEDRLRAFDKKSGVSAPDAVRGDLAQQVALSVGQLHQAQQAAAADRERMQSDRKQMAATPKRSPTQEASSPADKLLEDLHASLLAAQTKRTQLALKYSAHYPLVKEADQEIAETEAAIAKAEKTRFLTQTTDVDPTYELLREDLAKTQADIAAQRATVNATHRSIKSMQAQMVNLDARAITQQDLLREVKANEENYLLYLSKREQERTADALDKSRISNVTIAVPPAIPVLPVYSFPVVIAVAFVLASLASIVTAYAVDYCDSTFQSSGQVVDMLGIPFVVSIPKKTA